MNRASILAIVLSLVLSAGVAVAQETAPTPTAETQAPASLTIARMVIAGGVENREPVDVASTFPATQERVYCFLEFTDVPQTTTVNVVWTLGMNEMASVPLTIKAYAKYRTWAYKTIGGMKGDWKVEVKDESGNVLKSETFRVE